MTNAELFLQIYNEFDNYLHNSLNSNREHISHVDLLERSSKTNPFIRANESKLRTFAKLRNVIVHESNKEVYFIAEPHDAVIKQYEELVSFITNPPKVIDIAIKTLQVFSSTLDENVIEIINKMQEKLYTHVPILDKTGIIIGVLSESTIFRITHDQEIIIDMNSKVAEIRKYIEIEDRIMEYFEFVDRIMSVDELRDRYHKRFSKGERLGAYFVTNNGNPTEKFLGLITVWDLMR